MKKHFRARGNSLERSPSPTLAKKVWARDSGICIYCGEPAQVLDHVIRFADNSPTTSSNLVCCCNHCNIWRGKHPDDVDTLTRGIFGLSTHSEDISWMDKFYPEAITPTEEGGYK